MCCSCVCCFQLTADAMLTYGIDVHGIVKLADLCPGLQKVTMQKLRGAAADKIKEVIRAHERRVDETVDEDVRKG